MFQLKLHSTPKRPTPRKNPKSPRVQQPEASTKLRNDAATLIVRYLRVVLSRRKLFQSVASPRLAMIIVYFCFSLTVSSGAAKSTVTSTVSKNRDFKGSQRVNLVEFSCFAVIARFIISVLVCLPVSRSQVPPMGCTYRSRWPTWLRLFIYALLRNASSGFT